jgi:hypothetical protein
VIRMPGVVGGENPRGLSLSRFAGEIMPRVVRRLSPGRKAQHTAKWARTMTKWLVTYSRQAGARWNVVGFGGDTGAEARGVVDLVAIRKDHRRHGRGLKRGDLLEIVLIQTKGGESRRPSVTDARRLSRVATYHGANAVVLALWQRGRRLEMFRLEATRWRHVDPVEIFG